MSTSTMQTLVQALRAEAGRLGFSDCRITDTQVHPHDKHLQAWLERGYQGDMQWMHNHQALRCEPEKLHPGTLRIISVRMNYHPPATSPPSADAGVISAYATGRDYHKRMRKQLGKLSEWLANNSPHQGRPFVDSAPVLERGLAERAGLGWIGKNCMLIHPSAGSWFFLGELFTSLPLPVDDAWTAPHCGRCTDCLQACPTGAFTAEGVLDARRCISYLTIEHKGEIPVSMRPLIGNRIFGCDDCQTVCPWNKKFGRAPQAPAFTPDPRFINRELVKLFEWTEEQFLQETAGTPIRRLGYERWTRNLAVALGNAPASERIRQALRKKSGTTGALAQSHIDWALAVQSLPDLNLSVIRSSKLG